MIFLSLYFELYLLQTDFVRNIYQRLSKQNEKKWSIDQIYVDEAQDFTQAELYLLIQLCDCPSGMFLTGDTAQSIIIKNVNVVCTNVK
jgi:superfamily I DNA/RNA helicase